MTVNMSLEVLHVTRVIYTGRRGAHVSYMPHMGKRRTVKMCAVIGAHVCGQASHSKHNTQFNSLLEPF